MVALSVAQQEILKQNRIMSGGVRYFVKPTCMIATRCLGLKVNTSEGKAVNYFKNWVSVREV